MAFQTRTPILWILATVLTLLFLRLYLGEASLALGVACLLCVQAVAYCVYWAFIYPFCLSPLRGLPQATGGRFLLGHVTAAYEQPAGHTFLHWMRTIPNEGLIYYRGLFYQDRLLVTNPQTLGEVLVTRSEDFQKPAIIRDFLRSLVGNGLLVAEGDVHAFQRKNIAPAFTFRVVKDMYPVFWGKAKEFVQVITGLVLDTSAREPANEKSERDSSVVEIGRWASQVTLDTIGVAIGRDFQTLANSNDPLSTNYKELTRPTTENQIYFLCNMMFSPAFVSLWPWKMNRRNKRLLDDITSTCQDLIREKREELKSMTTPSKGYQDILSLVIESGNFSTPQLVEQMLTFLAAGHETTWSAFAWVAYILAKHPETQQRLRVEVLSHLPSPRSTTPSDDKVDLAIIDKLPLLNGVCNETLRLYPTIPMTARDVIRPTQLAGQYVPAGTQVIICPWAINRDDTLWGAEADEFKPERWIDVDSNTGVQRANNAGGASSNYAFLTFLHGPRSCIGQGFAKAELRFLVAAFVAAFEIEMADPKEEVTPYGVVAVKPKNGMNLRLKLLHG